ncbi:hypothetical protein AL060_05485 [Pseudomonas syringae pv. rhaphiolepidis]|nr:hypothetical protein AL060_05485 [Pseudomonas syringae pv. rhaphiolepidis]
MASDYWPVPQGQLSNTPKPQNLYQCNFMYKIFIAFFDELPVMVVAGTAAVAEETVRNFVFGHNM